MQPATPVHMPQQPSFYQVQQNTTGYNQFENRCFTPQGGPFYKMILNVNFSGKAILGLLGSVEVIVSVEVNLVEVIISSNFLVKSVFLGHF